MQITINDAEINEAIHDFIGKQGIAITDKQLDINFTAGRGVNGNSATVDIREPATIPVPPTIEDNIAATIDSAPVEPDHLFIEDE